MCSLRGDRENISTGDPVVGCASKTNFSSRLLTMDTLNDSSQQSAVSRCLFRSNGGFTFSSNTVMAAWQGMLRKSPPRQGLVHRRPYRSARLYVTPRPIPIRSRRSSRRDDAWRSRSVKLRRRRRHLVVATDGQRDLLRIPRCAVQGSQVAVGSGAGSLRRVRNFRRLSTTRRSKVARSNDQAQSFHRPRSWSRR